MGGGGGGGKRGKFVEVEKEVKLVHFSHFNFQITKQNLLTIRKSELVEQD